MSDILNAVWMFYSIANCSQGSSALPILLQILFFQPKNFGFEQQEKAIRSRKSDMFENLIDNLTVTAVVSN